MSIDINPLVMQMHLKELDRRAEDIRRFQQVSEDKPRPRSRSAGVVAEVRGKVSELFLTARPASRRETI